MNFKTGSFQLVVKVGSTEVPAHSGTVRRDDARKLQKAYRIAKPSTPTRVVKANA